MTLTFKYFECGTDLEFYELNLYLNLTRSVDFDYESDVGNKFLPWKLPGHYGVAVKPLLIIMIILDIVDLEESLLEESCQWWKSGCKTGRGRSS